jgi:hypothetical protein
MTFRESFSAWFYPPEVQLSEQFNFGHREVLIATHNLNPQTLFLGSLQHGWYENDPLQPVTQIRNRRLKPYPFFSWSLRQKNFLEDSGFKEVHAIGAPWAHLIKACGLNLSDHSKDIKIKSQTSNSNGNLLLFPRHSIPGGTVRHDLDVDHLLKLSDCTKATVCLFWMDFIDPAVRDYYSNFSCDLYCVGFKGNTGNDTPWTPAGGRVMFLPQLLDLMIRYEVIVCDQASTAFWYALSLGKSVIISSKIDRYQWWGNLLPREVEINNYSTLSRVDKSLLDLPIEQVIQPTSSLLDIALSEIGWNETEEFLALMQRKDITKQSDLNENLVRPVTEYINSFLGSSQAPTL